MPNDTSPAISVSNVTFDDIKNDPRTLDEQIRQTHLLSSKSTDINFFNQIGKSVLLCKIVVKKRDEVNRTRCFSVCGGNSHIDM